MKTTLLLSAVALLLVASPALAWDEPDSFRGVPWGASAEEAERILRERGDLPYCPDGGRVCSIDARVGPVPTKTILGFKDGQFTNAFTTFRPVDYPTLKRIFIDRYGTPTMEKDEPYQTKGGLKATNQVARWIGSKVVIFLRAYGDRIDEGRASFMLRAEVDKGIQEKEKVIQKGKGDL